MIIFMHTSIKFQVKHKLMFLKELLVTHSSDRCWSAVFRCEMCHWLCEDQDHCFLNFLCCLFSFGFFSQNELSEISVLMDVTGVDSAWTARMLNS